MHTSLVIVFLGFLVFFIRLSVFACFTFDSSFSEFKQNTKFNGRSSGLSSLKWLNGLTKNRPRNNSNKYIRFVYIACVFLSISSPWTPDPLSYMPTLDIRTVHNQKTGDVTGKPRIYLW